VYLAGFVLNSIDFISIQDGGRIDIVVILSLWKDKIEALVYLPASTSIYIV
jgi:hypothetical protein